MLAAKDEWLRPTSGERRPVTRYVPDGQGGHGEKVDEAQRVEAGLVDGIHGVGEPGWRETCPALDMPRHHDQEGKGEITYRQPQRAADERRKFFGAPHRAPHAE